MLCSACRIKENAVPETRWEKMRYWVFERFFVEEIKSITADAAIKAGTDGYQMGFRHALENHGYVQKNKTVDC